MEAGIQAQVCLTNTGKRKNPSHFWHPALPLDTPRSGSHASVHGTPVFCRTAPSPTPGAHSARPRQPGFTSTPPTSVMILLTTTSTTTRWLHSDRPLGLPSLVDGPIKF